MRTDSRVEALQTAMARATGLDRGQHPIAWMHVQTAAHALVYSGEPVDPPHLLRVLTDVEYRSSLASVCPNLLRTTIEQWQQGSSFDTAVQAHLPALRAWAAQHALLPAPTDMTPLSERLHAPRAHEE